MDLLQKSGVCPVSGYRRHLSGVMDAEFIAGDFFELALTKERMYLFRYFTTEIQRVFVRYMTVFGSYRHFCEHTGYVCTQRNLQLLNVRLQQLEAAHARAKSEMDLEALETVEKGEFSVPSSHVESKKPKASS